MNRRRTNPRRSLSRAIRNAVLERDEHRCIGCFTTVGPFEIDHITEVEWGGNDAIDNLRTLCKTCHVYRHLYFEHERWAFRHEGMALTERGWRILVSDWMGPLYSAPFERGLEAQ